MYVTKRKGEARGAAGLIRATPNLNSLRGGGSLGVRFCTHFPSYGLWWVYSALCGNVY